MTDARATPTTFQGLEAITLQAADGAQATVTLHGAHVVSWVPAGTAQEQLYLSPRSAFAPGQAIRGGVPVIFPQFSNRGPYPRHGFARTAAWTLLQTGTDGGAAMATLRITDDAASRVVWPHAFELQLRVRVAGDGLAMQLQCRNRGDAPLAFTAALHTYLQAAALDTVAVDGLGGCAYFDSVDGQNKTQTVPLLQFAGEVDRIYFDAPAGLQLRDTAAANAPAVHIAQQGFEDAVVWNPGAAKCAGLADMPPEGYRHMVCVEAAMIGRPVLLQPGQQWTGEQHLRLAR